MFNVNHLKYLLQKKYAPGIFREGENLGFKILKDYFECYISPHTFIQMTTKFISKLIQNSFTQLFCDILEDIKNLDLHCDDRGINWLNWNSYLEGFGLKDLHHVVIFVYLVPYSARVQYIWWRVKMGGIYPIFA